ncbi:hypothetical protein [Polaromonas sp. DSR2-3-2]|uniref:hypothetical protein n=2 Tax=unclassified Polaromonas TaxID=2638319 RepID=UPI003CEF7E59
MRILLAIAFLVGLWLFVSRHKRSGRGGSVSAGEAHSDVDVTKTLAKKAQPVLGWSMTLLGLVLMIPTTTVFAFGMPGLGSVGGGLMAGLAVGLVLFLLGLRNQSLSTAKLSSYRDSEKPVFQAFQNQ